MCDQCETKNENIRELESKIRHLELKIELLTGRLESRERDVDELMDNYWSLTP